MTKILIDRAVVEQALEALEFANVNHWWGSLTIEKAITDLRAALAEPQVPVCWYDPTDFTRTTNRQTEKEYAPLYTSPPQRPAKPVQEPLTIERLRDALVTSRIIPPAAVEDPDGYDDGVTLFRIEALHRRIT